MPSRAAGDCVKDALPRADLITMGMILHDWNLERKRENVFGLLMSLSMLSEFGDAFDYSGADFHRWCSEVGFERFDVLDLAGASSAAIAYK